MDPVLKTGAPRQIPVARPYVTDLDAECVRRAVSSGWVSQGPRVEEFEQAIAEAHGLKYGVACCSGTSALQLALAALGIREGERVACPTMTMVAVPNAILYVQGVPVFVDSDPETGNPDPAWVERVAWENPAAVIVPHLYGEPAAEFLAACRRHLPHTPVIEDCAEAHYARLPNGRSVGFANMATFSFYANKIVTSGEGGMVCTNVDDEAERMRQLRAHAFTPGNHFHHQGLAFGMRMTDMQAALGLAQHGRRWDFLRERSAIAHQYLGRLTRIPWLSFPRRSPGSVWWVFPLLVQRGAPLTRDELRAILADAGVETRTYFFPMHRQPHLRRYATDEYPVADDLAARGLYLPLFPGLTEDEVDYIADTICQCAAAGV